MCCTELGPNGRKEMFPYPHWICRSSMLMGGSALRAQVAAGQVQPCQSAWQNWCKDSVFSGLLWCWAETLVIGFCCCASEEPQTKQKVLILWGKGGWLNIPDLYLTSLSVLAMVPWSQETAQMSLKVWFGPIGLHSNCPRRACLPFTKWAWCLEERACWWSKRNACYTASLPLLL